MKIAFVSSLNPYDIRRWSGTLYHMLHTLSKHHEVVWLGEDFVKGGFWHHRLSGRKEPYYPENYVSSFARMLFDEISQGDYDFVVLRDNFLGISLDIPVAFVGDVTFDQFRHYLNVKEGYYRDLAESTEQQMIDGVDLLLYSSEWARNDAINHYHAKKSKIHVVEFGANIPHPSDYQAEIAMDVCNLVFIGRNWEKKGGDKVLGAYKKLKSGGFPCTCTLIGSVPPDFSENEDSDLTLIPFLDKSKPDDLERLCNILKTAHFLVLPTEFDAYGIVFCEASAYGVPSIAANVGGVSQPVREGKNGFLLPPDATAEDYAEKIKAVFSDKENYLKLRQSSRREYETRLNWDVWGEKVNKIFEETVKMHKKKKNKKQEAESDFYLPVYVINLKDRADRRKHIKAQFRGKKEFKLTWIDAVEHPIGAVGLWKSMVKVVETAIENDDDIMIICEDDHTFTSAYSKEYLLASIIGADEQGSELLSGGIGGFGTAVPVASNRYWVDWFWSTQFVVVFKPLFQKILDYDFKDTDTADGVLSVLAKDKMTMYPFVSVQTDFGYSDVTRSNDEVSGMVDSLFKNTSLRLNMIHHIAHKFKKEMNLSNNTCTFVIPFRIDGEERLKNLYFILDRLEALASPILLLEADTVSRVDKNRFHKNVEYIFIRQQSDFPSYSLYQFFIKTGTDGYCFNLGYGCRD